jgi:hypothetical protein
VPDGVTVLTAGVDVQNDRLELLVRGWGKGQESWLIDRKVFEGDTSKLAGVDVLPAQNPMDVPITRPSPWQRLDEYIERAAIHARARRAPAHCLHHGRFRRPDRRGLRVLPHFGRGIYAMKGVSGFNKPPLGQATRTTAREALSGRRRRDQGHAAPPPEDRHARRRLHALLARALRRGVLQAAHLGAAQAQADPRLPGALLGEAAGRAQRGARPRGLRLRRRSCA